MDVKAKGFFGVGRVGVSALIGLMAVAMVAQAQDTKPRRMVEPAAESTAAAVRMDEKDSDKDKDKKDGGLPVPAETKVETKHEWTAGARAVLCRVHRGWCGGGVATGYVLV